MVLPEGTKWQISPKDRTLQLSFSTVFSEIDLSNVFTRISRARVFGINADPSNQGLDILLTCDCGFRTALEGNSLLVIDIGEGFLRPVGNVDFNNWNNASLIEKPKNNAIELPVVFRKSSNNFLSSTSLTSSNASAALTESNSIQLKRDPFEEMLNTQEIKDATSLDLSELSSQIAGATSQGLLESNSQNKLLAIEPYDIIDAAKPHANMRTGFATELNDTTTRLDPQYPEGCTGKTNLDIANWGGELGFAAGLSNWRRSIMLEFDEVNAEAAIGLARHYLHYGFGREAQAALNLFLTSDSHPQAEYLRSMARIMDFGYDPLFKNTAWNLACDGEVALWSVLAIEKLSPSIKLDVLGLRLAFEALPQNLKQHLGPGLVKKFMQFGDNITAESILASVSRGQFYLNPELRFLQASKSLSSNNGEATVVPLLSIMKGNSQFSPLAVIALVDAAVAANQPIEKELLEIVSAYQFEQRKTEFSGELKRALVLSFAFSGNFDEAFEHLEGLTVEVSSPVYSETRAQVMKRVLEEADDIEFLKIALREPIIDITTVLENEFAERLLNIGFTENALEILAEVSDGQDGHKRRLLRAKAASLLNEPIVVEAALTGIPGEVATIVKAEAKTLKGDYSEALFLDSES
jgi:hypothetical protein